MTARPEAAGGAVFGLSNKPRTLLLKKLPKRGMGILSQIKYPRVSEPRNPFRISRRIDSVATFGQFLKLQSPGEESLAKHRPSSRLWPSSIKTHYIAPKIPLTRSVSLPADLASLLLALGSIPRQRLPASRIPWTGSPATREYKRYFRQCPLPLRCRSGN